MHKAEVVKLETPEGYLLDGLLYEEQPSDVACIFVHGLTGDAFAHHELLTPLLSKNISSLFFSNRGNNFIAKIKKRDERTAKGYSSHMIGQSHEVFTESVDDIAGAIALLKERGYKKIYLVGHSTGCQKSVYYVHKTQDPAVKGVVLLCPLSDYAYAVTAEDPKKLARAVAIAQDMVKDGREHELLPSDIWPELLDAQRFLSLYTPDSDEEIFTYSQEGVTPGAYQDVSKPLLAVFAGEDEYADRKAEKLEEWFRENNHSTHFDSKIMAGSVHNLHGYEKQTAQTIYTFIDKTLDI